VVIVFGEDGDLPLCASGLATFLPPVLLADQPGDGAILV
jgi:hypothetical protein